MKYDPALPIAVFLGPSLDRASAEAILPANYYPPVRYGDVYRLATCGVRLIVIIDGVFHGTSPVWQREIVAAMNNGVTVVGASSMGALRAIELEPLGMIGLGTVVEWYRSGRIEGDDEVALQHADGDYDYRGLSEPLVNIRWHLERAAGAGVISDEARAALTDAMSALEYGARAYPSLFENAAFTGLPAAAQAALRAVVSDGVNLKQADARAALAWCAERLPSLLERSKPPRYEGRSIERVDELLLRGVPAPDHALPRLQDVLVRAAADRERTAHIVNHASRRFYLLDWAAKTGVRGPDGLAEAYEQRWTERQGVNDRSTWLSANGLTEAELGRELAGRALEAWLLEQGPERLGLDRPILEAWAAAMGIEAPSGMEADAAGRGRFRTWLVEKNPNYFGFDQWSPDIAFARELQLNGDVARLAAEYRAEPAVVEMGAAHGARAV